MSVVAQGHFTERT